jgi:hypothetical protein
METTEKPDLTKLLSAWYVLQELCLDLAEGATAEIRRALSHTESLVAKEIARHKPLFPMEHEDNACGPAFASRGTVSHRSGVPRPEGEERT